MTFEDTLYDVTTKMDARVFHLMNHGNLDKDHKPLEEIVRLSDITVTSDGMAALKVETDSKKKKVTTNRRPEYFDGYVDKVIYFRSQIRGQS